MKTRKEEHVPYHKGGTHTYNCLNDGNSGRCDCEELSKPLHTNVQTSNEMRHTPTPWHVGMQPGPMVYGPLGEQIADCRAMIASGEAGRNAIFIVRACNNFEGVLGALKMFCVDHTTPCGCENCAIIKRAEK